MDFSRRVVSVWDFFFFETRGSRNSWGVKVEGRVCWNEIVLKTTLDDCL